MRQTEELFTVRQVAQRLHLREETIREWIAAKRLKAAMIGRKWLIPASEIDALLTVQTDG